MGHRLPDTIASLRRLQQRLLARDARERRVARVTAAAKLGASLVPVVGAALRAGVDVVAAFADGAPGATAVEGVLADPSDTGAALTALRCARDAGDLPLWLSGCP